MKRSIVSIMIILCVLSACSNEPESAQRTIFESEGEYWTATIDNTVIEQNGKRYFQIHYTYMGDPNDLDSVEKIVFAQGTSLGTQVVNVFDPGYKEKLISEARYQEEDEEKFGIVIENIKDRDSGAFVIEYDLIQDGDGYSVLDAIEKDKLNIQIKWETNDRTFEDKLNK